MTFKVSKWPYRSSQHDRSLASGANASLVAKNGTKIKFQMSQFFITISCYLEAEIDYKPFILCCRVVFQDYAQKVSSWFYQNWRRDSNFCDFPITLWKRGQRPPEQPNGPWGPKEPPSPPQELEGGPKLLVSQYFLAPIGVLLRLFLHIGDFVRILMLHFPKSTIKKHFFGNPKTYKFSRLIIL